MPPAITPAATKAVSLDTPIVRGDSTIATVEIFKPTVRALKGIPMTAVIGIESDALAKLFPRITRPALTETEVLDMDAADFVSLATGLLGFLVKGEPESPND